MTVPDVVALGEPLLRLSPPSDQTLETATTMHVYVGGSEVNTLVGLARLGHTTSLLSRLPDNPLGRHIERTLHAEGTETRHVVRSPSGRVGCYWYEPSQVPRDLAVIYDRAGSAMTEYQPGDLPPELFDGQATGTFHTTGITMAVSASARSAALAAMTKARAMGWRVSFDTNFRSLMWGPAKAEEALSVAGSLADILIVPARDAIAVFGIDGGAGAEGALKQLRRRFPHQTIVVTDGSEGAVGSAPEGPLLRQEPIAAEGVDRIGRGDAFTAGLLHGLIKSDDSTVGLQRGLRWGAVMAALKFATPGDMPLVDVEAAKRLVDASDASAKAEPSRQS